jgi:hypothetical protein
MTALLISGSRFERCSAHQNHGETARLKSLPFVYDRLFEVVNKRRELANLPAIKAS